MKTPLMWETTISGQFPKGGPVAEDRNDSARREQTTEIIARLEGPEPVDDTLDRVASGEDLEAAGALVPVKQTKLSDVAAVAGSYARERREGVGSYVKRHPKRIALLIVVLIVAIFAVVMAGLRASNLPDVDLIRESAHNRVETPSYSGGFYGFDDPLALASVEVGNRRHLSGAPDSTAHDVSFGATSYAEADVTLSYRNEHISAVKTATIGFAEHPEGWIDAGIPMNEQVAFAALTGVNEEKVLSNINLLFDRADASTDPSERTLQEIYYDAELEVQAHSFDPVEQTDLIVIHCSAKQGVSTYECLLSAQFTFLPANGLWELTGATTSKDAKTRSLSLLEGTWNGSFSSQRVSEGNNCLAGSGNPMTMIVEGVGELSGKTVLDAKVTLVAHLHEPPESSQDESADDVWYENEPITCTLVGELGNKLVFEGALSERAAGTISIRLEVDDADRITATVTTVYNWTTTEGFIITWETDHSVTYTDTYTLRRAAE